MTWIAIGGFVVFVVLVVMAVDASRRLLDVHVDQGRVLKLEGRVPVELVHDVEDVLQRAKESGRVIVRLEGNRARVRVSGEIGEGTAQQLRNVVGRFPTARLRAARPVKR
ncbi:MAG TPA: DUF3634 family protein [Polyangium sp.]|nr:DUF3634 family protein [Polyangium sp.]